ncbi:MAG: ACGX-repeat peptide [Clostridia bacterium]|nr:ACGX-repeat peptide [Clostridia bacterium]
MALKNLFGVSQANAACGSACGSEDKKTPSACGSACGSEDKKEAPSACGSACGTADKE